MKPSKSSQIESVSMKASEIIHAYQINTISSIVIITQSPYRIDNLAKSIQDGDFRTLFRLSELGHCTILGNAELQPPLVPCKTVPFTPSQQVEVCLLGNTLTNQKLAIVTADRAILN